MQLRKLALFGALLATCAVTAAASPFTYTFTATSQNGITFTGGFDLAGGQITNFSFDFTPGINHDSDLNNGVLLHPIDNTGSYVMDNSNTGINCNNNCGAGYYNFVTYAGSGTAGTGVTGSGLNLTFSLGVPGSLKFGGYSTFNQNPPSGGAVSNFTDYFQAGGAALATPEPATWALSLTGGVFLLAGYLWMERRRVETAA